MDKDVVDPDSDAKLLSSFEKLDYCLGLLNLILSVDLSTDPTPEEDQREGEQLKKLTGIVRCSKTAFGCLLKHTFSFTNSSTSIRSSRICSTLTSTSW